MYSLVNKTVIITGGANGVGASIVKEFLKENVKVSQPALSGNRRLVCSSGS